MNLPPLDSRLQTIEQLVPICGGCADIGCDHGYLVTHLAATGKIARGFACDVNVLPLKRAAQTIQTFGMEKKVTACLTDGLKDLPDQQIDTVIIAGMGGDLIWKILTDMSWTKDPSKQYILQPMTKAYKLRELLVSGGFSIERETAVQSADFTYTILSVVYTGVTKFPSPLYTYTGELLTHTDPCALDYLARVSNMLTAKIAGLEKSKAATNDGKDCTAYREIVEILAKKLNKPDRNVHALE